VPSLPGGLGTSKLGPFGFYFELRSWDASAGSGLHQIRYAKAAKKAQNETFSLCKSRKLKLSFDAEPFRVLSPYMQNELIALPAVTVTETTRTDLAVYVQATSGKISAFIGITEDRVQVICQNAMHRAFKYGAGRFFPTIAEAVAAYKKPEMKAIILAADAFNR
jgi:hypothetical protein